MFNSDKIANNIAAVHIDVLSIFSTNGVICMYFATVMLADEYLRAVHLLLVRDLIHDPDRADGALAACEVGLPPLLSLILGDRAGRGPV